MSLHKVNRTTLTEALKKHLLADDNASSVAAEMWNGEGWLTVTVGKFYQHDDDLVLKNVRELTNGELKQINRKMNKVSWDKMRAAVSAKSSCGNVVDEMVSATLTTDPLIPGQETP